MPINQRHLRVISRRFWGLFFGSIIAFAVLVQIGRQAFPLINDYKHIIAQSMGDQLGVLIDIGEISAEWQGLRPKVILHRVLVQSQQGQEVFSIDTALAELSLIDSFIQGGPAWRTITFREFRTTFIQKENLTWSIKGYDGGTANTDNPFLFDDPLDIFLFGRRVQIEQASLNFEFKNGKQTELTIPSINLENDRFFHRMTASLSIEGKEALNFVVEGYGDPRNKAKFSASGYLGLKDIRTTDIYNAIFSKDDGASELSASDELTNLEIWFKGSPQAGMTTVGSLSISGLPAALQAHFDLPEGLHADISGAWKDGSGWFLNLQNMEVDWQDHTLPLSTLSFYGQGYDIGVRIQELDVTAVVDAAIAANTDQDRLINKAIAALKPRGRLTNIDVSLLSKEQGYFNARMNIEQGAIDAFKGSPALENVSGYAELSLTEGYVDAEIDKGFAIALEKAFAEPFILDNARGQLAWRIDYDKKTAYLKSSEMSATQDQSRARGALAMTLPFSREVGEQKMTLMLDVDQSDLLAYEQYVPKHVPDQLKSWLKSALRSGSAENIAILFRGSVSKDPEIQPLYQIYGEAKNVVMQYDPKWPNVSEASGTLFVDSGAFDVRLDGGSVSGAEIRSASVALGSKRDGNFPPIEISADVFGQTKSAQNFLAQSPISKDLSSFVSQWTFDGHFESKVDITVPLSFKEEEIEFEVATQLIDNQAQLESVGLQFDQFEGSFIYSKNRLAESENLSLSLWGQDVETSVQSDKQTGDVKVIFNSRVNAEQLKSWLKRPELFALTSDFDVDGEILIPTRADSKIASPQIHMRSELKGVDLNLPSLLGKSADQTGEYALSIRFTDDGVDYQYKHNNAALVDIHMSQTLAPAIRVQLGKSFRSTVKIPGQVMISGHLEQADFDQWLSAYERYSLESQKMSELVEVQNSSASDKELLVTANLSIDTFSFSDFVFPDLALNINNAGGENWLFSINAERAKGRVSVASESEPITLDFDSLSLVSAGTAASSETISDDDAEPPLSVFADLDLNELTAFDVDIRQLKIQNQDWGSWQFLLNPIENGIHLDNVKADFKALRIGQNAPSQFYWTRNGSNNLSHFNGQIEVDNVATTLEAWDQEGIVTSKRGVFDIRAQWLAEPDLVELANLNGDIELQLNEGSFVRATVAGENPLLRLIALLNFDTLARRLRLDFSDLAAKGFAYDRVSSKINFTNGIATLSEPVVVESSSSRMQMAGKIDLINEQVDAELVVTLPVAGNLAVATAFLVGVPAGVGVYIVSKMLGEAVDKVSSINYSVNGAWDDPKIKVRKIFDDEAALRKGEQLKQEKAEQKTAIEKANQPQETESE